MMVKTRLEMPARVAISASESPDITAFGLSKGHMWDALEDLILQVLAANMDFVYGGDLRREGFTRLLFELATRYTPSDEIGKRIRVTNHLAWPVHLGMEVEQIESLAAELEGVAQLVLIGADARPMTPQARRRVPTRTPDTREWIEGLTAMRHFQVSHTEARVALGGQVTEYKGRMPGVAEEALVSLRAHKPLYLVGGFGGATRAVAETLGLAECWDGSRVDWCGHAEFQGWTGDDLRNGLSRDENVTLATTSFVRQAVVLVLRGLYRLSAARNGNKRGTSNA